MITLIQLRQIVRGLEFANHKIIGIRLDDGQVSLAEASQEVLLNALVVAINQQLQENVHTQFVASLPSERAEHE